jgi:hypothetical protein
VRPRAGSLTLAPLALLALTTCAPARSAPPREAVAEAAPAPRAEAVPAPAVREIDGAVPDDMVVDFRRRDAARSMVSVARDGYLVALLRGKDVVAHIDAAAIEVRHRDDKDAPLVWEVTHPQTMETARGVIHFDIDGRPHLRRAEPPTPVGRVESGRAHRCQAHEGALGGFTVLCRVPGGASVAGVTGVDPGALSWVAPAAGAGIARFDLPARPDSVDARVLGYSDGMTGVLVRIEASFLPGEERASLAMLSSERQQPEMRRFFHHRFEE